MSRKQYISFWVAAVLVCTLLVCGFSTGGATVLSTGMPSVCSGGSYYDTQEESFSDIRLSAGMNLHHDASVLWSRFGSQVGVREAVVGRTSRIQRTLTGGLWAALLALLIIFFVRLTLFRVTDGRQQLLEGRILNFIHNQDGKKRSFSIYTK